MHCLPPIFYRREPEMGRDREGTAMTGTAKDTGGQPWASPFLSAPQFPHHKPVGPENMTATQAQTIPEPLTLACLGVNVGFQGVLESKSIIIHCCLLYFSGKTVEKQDSWNRLSECGLGAVAIRTLLHPQLSNGTQMCVCHAGKAWRWAMV